MAFMNDQGIVKNSTPLRFHFGKVLRHYREERGMSQTQLANQLHYSPSYVSLLESNDRRPSEELIKDIAQILELTTAEVADLLSAAGYTFRDIGTILDRLVEEISIQVPMDLIGLRGLREHLSTTVQVWQEYQRALHDLDFGEFALAEQRLTTLRSAVRDDALKVRILHALADIKFTLGQVTEAEELAGKANTIVDAWDIKGQAPHQPPIDVVAESWGVRSTLALQQGKYDEAYAFATRSLGILENFSAEQGPENQLYQISIARTYKRIAVIHLLQGAPEKALHYCNHAEQFLEDPALGMWRLRLQEVRAWALTESHQYMEAFKLRENTQEQWKRLDNRYRLARNWIYFADDYRQWYEALLAAESDTGPHDADTRRARIVRVVEQHQYINLATVAQYCSDAILAMEHAQDQLLLGRALIGFAAIRRLQAATSNEATQYFDEVISALVRALDALGPEESPKNVRHISTIYDIWAKTFWDQGYYAKALRHFKLERDALSKYPVLEFTQHPQHDLDRVSATIHLLTDMVKISPQSDQAQHIVLVREVQWESNVRAVLKLLRDRVKDSTLELAEGSHHSHEWLRRVISVEKKPGSRILIQSELSSALSEMMPAGYLPIMADDHMQRYRRLQEIIRGHSINKPQVFHHVFSQTNVKDGLAYAPTRSSVQDRVKTALAISRKNPDIYDLRSVDFEVPFAIEIRDDEVLIEIREDVLGAKQTLAEHIRCYYAKNRPFAEELGRALEQLIAMTHNSDETVAWLKELNQQETAPPLSAPYALGSSVDADVEDSIPQVR